MWQVLLFEWRFLEDFFFCHIIPQLVFATNGIYRSRRTKFFLLLRLIAGLLRSIQAPTGSGGKLLVQVGGSNGAAASGSGGGNMGTRPGSLTEDGRVLSENMACFLACHLQHLKPADFSKSLPELNGMLERWAAANIEVTGVDEAAFSKNLHEVFFFAGGDPT